MSNTNNEQTSNGMWVFGGIALLLVLLAAILSFYNYWRMSEASRANDGQPMAALEDVVPAKGGMVLHTPLPLSSALDAAVVSTPVVEPEVTIQNQIPAPLFMGEYQAGQVVEAIDTEGSGVLFCADASAHSVIMNEYRDGDRFTIVPASGEYDASPVENDGMVWYRLVAPDGLVGWMGSHTFQAVEGDLLQKALPEPTSTPAG